MADDQRQKRGAPSRDALESSFDPRGLHETLNGHGEISEGLPPRHIGGAPGFGSHGMGYGPQGSGNAWGVYGVPRDVAQDYVEGSRAGSPGDFDQPHGRVGFGWEGAFGSEGESSAAADRMGPAQRAPRGGSGDMRGGMPRHDTDRSVRRGPKNYTRSDERIQDEICESIGRDSRIDASDVTIDVKAGKVTLYGSVAHRQMKHWIEDIAADCHGVTDVENKLTVAIAAASPADRRMSPP
jgi:hypothetical protein